MASKEREIWFYLLEDDLQGVLLNYSAPALESV
jgi:hypothetical protein